MMRRVSRQVNVGGVKIGGDAPIAIQSMLNALASDFEGNLKAIIEKSSGWIHKRQASHLQGNNKRLSFSEIL